jgi:hypothetical protein
MNIDTQSSMSPAASPTSGSGGGGVDKSAKTSMFSTLRRSKPEADYLSATAPAPVSPKPPTKDVPPLPSPNRGHRFGHALVSLRGKGKKDISAEPQKPKSAWERYRSEKLPPMMGKLMSAALVILALSLFYTPLGGTAPRLVKRDAPLVSGDTLKGGEYITSCTGLLAPLMDW